MRDLDHAVWHADLCTEFDCAGRVVKVWVSSVSADGLPRFGVEWSSRPDRLTASDCAVFTAHKRAAAAALSGRLAVLQATT